MRALFGEQAGNAPCQPAVAARNAVGPHYAGQPVLSPGCLGCAKLGEGNLCGRILIGLDGGSSLLALSNDHGVGAPPSGHAIANLRSSSAKSRTVISRAGTYEP
jgi:hypothetical protein